MVRDLVDRIHDLVKLQVADLRRELHGEGNLAIRPAFARQSQHLASHDRENQESPA